MAILFVRSADLIRFYEMLYRFCDRLVGRLDAERCIIEGRLRVCDLDLGALVNVLWLRYMLTY